MTPIRLLVGIGNPGSKFENTRHNAGQSWLEALADRFRIQLLEESKHQGYVGRGQILNHDVRLLVPLTYVNASGLAVQSICHYFDISPEEVLVAYDEVAFPPGTTKLKFGGGTNGHNGLKSILQQFGGDGNFGRLRIGVGHPGDPHKLVRYLTRVNMPSSERELAEESSQLGDQCMDWLLKGDWQRAMTSLHTPVVPIDEEVESKPPDDAGGVPV